MAPVTDRHWGRAGIAGTDARARLCALDGRTDEAGRWFAAARTVLDTQGARPLSPSS